MYSYYQCNICMTIWFQSGTHGCKLTEVIPGLYTAHFEDIQPPTFFQDSKDFNPPVGLIINAAIAHNQCPDVTGYYGPSIEVVCIHLFDDPKPTDTHAHAGNAKVFFPTVNKAVKETIDSGKSALIHCYGSLSRSVVFIIAYLMEFNGLSAVEATKFLKAKWDATWCVHHNRWICITFYLYYLLFELLYAHLDGNIYVLHLLRPNDLFVQQLVEFEQELESKRITSSHKW